MARIQSLVRSMAPLVSDSARVGVLVEVRWLRMLVLLGLHYRSSHLHARTFAQDNLLHRRLLTTIPHQIPEKTPLDPEQFSRCAKLHRLPLIHDEDSIEIRDGAEAVGDDEERRAAVLVGAEFGADGPLDDGVGGGVDGRGGLVQDQDLGLREDGARETEELALALGEREPALRYGR